MVTHLSGMIKSHNKKEKIGILGGTFDPIHIGHLIAAENARDAMNLDKVLLVPTGHSYFKEDQNVTNALTRYEMVCAAVKDNPYFEVSDLEVKKPGNSYTWETIKSLKEQDPDCDLYYIVGADTLVLMSLWKNPQYIFDSCTILVQSRDDEVTLSGTREEINSLQHQYGADCILLPIRNIELSSTEIRERIKKGKSIHYLVSPHVEAIIREKKLYQEKSI